jgi:hypothetical protein
MKGRSWPHCGQSSIVPCAGICIRSRPAPHASQVKGTPSEASYLSTVRLEGDLSESKDPSHFFGIPKSAWAALRHFTTASPKSGLAVSNALTLRASLG